MRNDQPLGFALIEKVLDEAIDAAAARAAAQAGAQLGQVGHVARRHHFHMAVLGVAHPAAQRRARWLPDAQTSESPRPARALE